MTKAHGKTKDITLNILSLLRISSLIAVLSLTGCANFSQAPVSQKPLPTRSWSERETLLNRINNWDINGKVAIHTPRDSGSGSLNWIQRQSRYTISLMGPMGTNSIRLSGQPGAITLLTADGKRYTASSPENLLAQRWGFRLPVSNLKYWVRGLPAPGNVGRKQLDSQNRLIYLQQDGWRIQFAGYSNQGQIELPTQITLASPELNSKLIIYQWKI